MKKQLLAALTAAAVGMSLVWVGTAPAQTRIPETVQIEDPDGDSNGLNDQGLRGVIGYQGDNSGGVSIGAGDILKVWFTNDADNLSAHILTTFPPPNNTPGFGLIYRVMFNPDSDTSDGCIWLEGVVPSKTYQGTPSARVFFACETKDALAGEIVVEELEDGTGITTLTFPRATEPAFADGEVLASPRATTRAMFGADGAPRRLTAPQLDNTQPGTDYTITSESPNQAPDKKCPSKGKKKGKKKQKPKQKPRPTASPSPTSAPTTPPPAPEMMAQTPTPSPTAEQTAPPGQQKECPRQKGKKKQRPKPRPSRTPNPEPSTRPTPSPSTT